MVASLKQVQQLVEQYRKIIIDKIKDSNYEFSIEEGDIVGDEEVTMSIDNLKVNTDEFEPDMPEEEGEKKEEEKEEIPKDNNEGEITYHKHDENNIDTMGEYTGYTPDSNRDDLIL